MKLGIYMLLSLGSLQAAFTPSGQSSREFYPVALPAQSRLFHPIALPAQALVVQPRPLAVENVLAIMAQEVERGFQETDGQEITTCRSTCRLDAYGRNILAHQEIKRSMPMTSLGQVYSMLADNRFAQLLMGDASFTEEARLLFLEIMQQPAMVDQVKKARLACVKADSSPMLIYHEWRNYNWVFDAHVIERISARVPDVTIKPTIAETLRANASLYLTEEQKRAYMVGQAARVYGLVFHSIAAPRSFNHMFGHLLKYPEASDDLFSSFDREAPRASAHEEISSDLYHRQMIARYGAKYHLLKTPR